MVLEPTLILQDLAMFSWYTIILSIATLIIGFFLRIFQERILEKKVSLSHRLDEPAVFSDIPPTVCFQTLHIFNRGKLPAKNVRVCLDEESIKNCHAEYKPLTEDDFSVESKQSVLILKFERLLPGDGLPISFKSSNPLPKGFVAWVKSDEMVSRVSRGEAGIPSLSNLPLLVMVLGLSVTLIAALIYLTGLDIKSKIPEKLKPASFEIHLMTDKLVYSKNQPMEVMYKIKNITGNTVTDLEVRTLISGFELDFNERYRNRSFLASQEEFLQKIPVLIPKDVPPGKYRILVTARGEIVDETLSDEAQAFFEVK